MSNYIGYIVFKKVDGAVIDFNGMFEKLNLSNDEIIDDSPSLEVREKRLSYKRIASSNSNSTNQDAVLVTLLERIQKNNSDCIIGSGIVFKEWQVNEQKVIDGLKYLLAQLKKNIENEADLNEKDLGVILPSVNKDFGIFKNQKLPIAVSSGRACFFDDLTSDNEGVSRVLHYFCIHESFNSINHLILASNPISINRLNDRGFKRINNIQEFIHSENSKSDSPYGKEIQELEQKLTDVRSDQIAIVKAKKVYKILAISAGLITIILGVLLFYTNSKDKDIDRGLADNSLYPINGVFYIDNKDYNVNVRSTPMVDTDNSNVTTTLSDGDEVYVLGLDKETLWANIRYNDDKDVGYVSHTLIAKQINERRIKSINRPAKIHSYNAGLFSVPEEDVLIYLQPKDEIFIKNKVLNSNWFSVRVTKDNEAYNGYLEEQNFKFQ